MTEMKRRLLFFAIVAAVLLLVVGISPPSSGAADTPKQGAAATAQKPDPSQFIGAESCKACHEDTPTKGFYKNFEATPHYKTITDTRKGPEWQGCEACHGPGAEHMNSGGDKTKIFDFKGKNTKDISKRCLACHEYGEEHANFARSAHNVNDVSCVDCHSIHKAKEKQFLLVKKQPDLCFSCHATIKPEFARPFRHRVNEGLLKCTDCHNQHGGFLTRQLRTTSAQDTVCFKCHADKAGPFVFEHAPVKTEGCVSCHVPHGSSNARMLKRSQINLLCLECHTLTGGGLPPQGPSHDQSQKYQSCTICHVAVHGSNHSNVFFR